MKKISKKIKYNFELLDFNKILSVDVMEVKGLKYENKKKTFGNYLNRIYRLFKFFLSTIFKCIFYYPKIKHSIKNERNIFYIRSYSRADLAKHSALYERIEGTSTCLTFEKIKKIDLGSFFFCIYHIFKVRKLWVNVLNANDVNFYSLNGLKIFLSFFNSFSESIKIFPTLLMHSKVVSFQEIRCTENILCQLANLKNIETFALEHAIGAHKKNGTFWERYTSIIYSSSVCRNILCWGKYSENLFKKYSKAKVHIIGKAYLPEIEKLTDGVTFIFQSNRWKSANDKLLSLSVNLKKFGIPISHWFKGENLLNKNNALRDGPLHKIVIGSSTNLLAELGFLGLNVYLIKESVFLEHLKNNFYVDNSNQIRNIYVSNIFYPNNVWKDFIECTDNESISRYKKIINNKRNLK